MVDRDVSSKQVTGTGPASSSSRAAALLNAIPETLYCPDCEYNLTGLTENRCPECGKPFDPRDLVARMVETVSLGKAVLLLMWPHLLILAAIVFAQLFQAMCLLLFVCFIAVVVLLFVEPFICDWLAQRAIILRPTAYKIQTPGRRKWHYATYVVLWLLQLCAGVVLLLWASRVLIP